MRFAPIALILLAACATARDPARSPFAQVMTGTSNSVNAERRGAVELIVKTRHAAIITDLRAGGGPDLTRAMDAAQIRVSDRPARILQLQGDLPLYAANLGALTTALLLFGG